MEGVAVRDVEVASRLRYLSTQAKDNPKMYIHNMVGYNYWIGNINVGIGLAQLKKLERFIDLKYRNYNKYVECGISLRSFQENIRSNYWFYSYIAKDRNILIDTLEKNNVQSRALWMPVHLQKPYRKNQSFHIEYALQIWKRLINIPCSTAISSEDIEAVAEIIHASETMK